MRFLSGVLMTALALSSWTWWAPACMVIGLVTFYKPLSRLTQQVLRDSEFRRLERELAAGLHVNADARIAWEYFHG